MNTDVLFEERFEEEESILLVIVVAAALLTVCPAPDIDELCYLAEPVVCCSSESVELACVLSLQTGLPWVRKTTLEAALIHTL